MRENWISQCLRPRNMSRWPIKYKQAPPRVLIKTPHFFLLCSIQPFSTRHCRGEQRISVVDNNEEAAHVWWQSQNYDETNNTEGWGELEEATNDEKQHLNYKLECCCGCFFCPNKTMEMCLLLISVTSERTCSECTASRGKELERCRQDADRGKKKEEGKVLFIRQRRADFKLYRTYYST